MAKKSSRPTAPARQFLLYGETLRTITCCSASDAYAGQNGSERHVPHTSSLLMFLLEQARSFGFCSQFDVKHGVHSAFDQESTLSVSNTGNLFTVQHTLDID